MKPIALSLVLFSILKVNLFSSNSTRANNERISLLTDDFGLIINKKDFLADEIDK